MKKIFMLLIMLSMVVLPMNVEAKSYRFNYYCDSKQDQGDGTFRMVCHLNLNADFDINHVAGDLILKNVTLESISTKSDWVNNNKMAINVDFTSTEFHSGNIEVADIVFKGFVSDTDCEASFMPDTVEARKVETPKADSYSCAIVDDIFYGKNGGKVTEEQYYEECCNYVCAIVDDFYYFDSNGKSVTYEEYLKDCSQVENPVTGFNYGILLIPVGIGAVGVISMVARRKSKIFKI